MHMQRAVELDPEFEPYQEALERLLRRIPEACAEALRVRVFVCGLGGWQGCVAHTCGLLLMGWRAPRRGGRGLVWCGGQPIPVLQVCMPQHVAAGCYYGVLVAAPASPALLNAAQLQAQAPRALLPSRWEARRVWRRTWRGRRRRPSPST